MNSIAVSKAMGEAKAPELGQVMKKLTVIFAD